jgi:hypothetical protein
MREIVQYFLVELLATILPLMVICVIICDYVKFNNNKEL